MANYVETLRSSYLENLTKAGLSKKAVKLSENPVYSPIFQFEKVHAEEEPSLSIINDTQYDIENDLNIISMQLIKTANDFKTLMESCKADIEDTIKTINKEKEKQQDINIICNNYQDFADIKTLNEDSFTGDFTNTDGIFSAKITQFKKVDFNVSDVVGNGYEGNKYVYNKNTSAFVSDSINTGNRNFINDGSIINVYEYSRLTASNTEKDIVPEINYDSLEARCTISMNSNTSFNSMKIKTDSTMLQLSTIETSEDGIQYDSIITEAIPISNSDMRYNISNYIPGSGILSFPDTKYVRATFESTGYTADSIAFNKTVLSTDSNNKVVESKSLINLNTAKRHLIKINDITALRNVYKLTNSFNTSELIKEDPAKCIALFANEYIPAHFAKSNEYIKYTITINGKDYDIVPVNSNKNGIKIIRNSEYSSESEYSAYLNEDIKSASLKITIKTPNKYETPYLSNIKLLIGR